VRVIRGVTAAKNGGMLRDPAYAENIKWLKYLAAARQIYQVYQHGNGVMA